MVIFYELKGGKKSRVLKCLRNMRHRVHFEQKHTFCSMLLLAYSLPGLREEIAISIQMSLLPRISIAKENHASHCNRGVSLSLELNHLLA